MKYSRVAILIFLLGISIFWSINAAAVNFPEKPPNSSFYVDKAGLIRPDDGKEINRISSALLKQEKIPLFVVTIPSLSAYEAAGQSIEQYTRALFDNWGIGFQDRNYGMLLLVSEGDRKARIEFGKGWDHRHDYDANQIMQNLIIPQFKKGQFSNGILQGVRGLDAAARGLALPKPKQPIWVIPALIIGIIAIVAIAYSLFKSGRTGWGWAFLAGVGILLFFILRAAASSSGSGGGFGGGSGGGGGATGSW